ncbi:glycosyltransferase family 2 protein [Methanoculleus sp.]|uniref:glycosyltransferase family 2 protein n=1 Tax=Methanoculleus sp. TaxID=90427 RepID=UPI002C168112|nr:glycosyltransferase family 2 protein [Methanoculleus sp.]HNT08773.1 glycosyltransferase family 2 protein [Methanoculleus sp.]
MGIGDGDGMGISACLITKNEEEALARSLKMISAYVDEIVIVDGQSEDKTVEVAREFDAVVIQREFSGSFAIERNSGIERARNEWVFILDPDETLEPGFLQTLRDLATSRKYDAYSFLRHDVLPDGTILETPCGHPEIHVRLAKKDRLRYYGAIHEKAVVSGKIKFIPEAIYHHRGYFEDYPAEKKERFEAIGRNASEDLQGLKISSHTLLARNVKLVFHYFRNMLIGMGLYRKGPSGIIQAIRYTYSFTSYGLKQYVRLGQI